MVTLMPTATISNYDIVANANDSTKLPTEHTITNSVLTQSRKQEDTENTIVTRRRASAT